ncbi:hypothetical protein BXZ70DRAFT_990684 [Cristinia sonorae]|uniref:RFX-type winged-helix domain-containing protein n=1 Tax=Cristinia sonorae TaxID=1940300 RepID=A0A8K0XNS3_9AGAR|nr:hypothetical protein BXZ70DRAFT_990684 [Cristinia sonorae]
MAMAAATGTQMYRQGHPAQSQPLARVDLVDNSERWYTEPHVPNNRMVMALRSGIDTEVEWALERLCRLSINDKFILSHLPGLTHALFVWPEWFIHRGAMECAHLGSLFALPPDLGRRKRHALESVFVLRNTSLIPENALELAGNQRARAIILLALHHISPQVDANAEFILYIIEILQSMAVTLVLPPPNMPYLANPLPPLAILAEACANRSIIIACLSTLTLLLSNPANFYHLDPATPALNAAVRYLALFESDRELAETCLNYLYAHLAHPAMSKAFLLHPLLSPTLRLLTLILKSEQVEQDVVIPIGGQVFTAPIGDEPVRLRELTPEESERLLGMDEPERCIEWLKIMYVGNPDAETTQVDLWTLYRNTFTVPGRSAILQAQEVIKNASTVFIQATAMVLPGPQQRFIVRGIERAKDTSSSNRFRCRWQGCDQITQFSSTAELYDHLLETHITNSSSPQISCAWGPCTTSGLPKSDARRHVLTHLPPMQSFAKHPAQPDSVTLPSEGYPHPVPDPTTRPPPPPRRTEVTTKTPVSDPPSNALTALLCIRVLFRSSFASSDAAPRVDEDHFGFPGVVEDTRDEGEEEQHAETDAEKEGERKGRKAFIGIRRMLEDIRIRDETLMSWVTEMVEAGVTGTT